MTYSVLSKMFIKVENFSFWGMAIMPGSDLQVLMKVTQTGIVARRIAMVVRGDTRGATWVIQM